ncbi:MAG: DMT family transporter [Polyangiales bacterium]
MRVTDNDTLPRRATFSLPSGLISAALGVLAFSLSLTATRAAMGSFGAVTVSAGRAVIAAPFAALWLWRRGERLPDGKTLRALVVVALGVVLGFPVLSSIALREVSATHGAVVFSVTPALTAVFGCVLARERPSLRFWVASALATIVALSVALTRTHGPPSTGDALLLAAIVLVAAGYAMGGRLARDALSGPSVICWALVLSLPITLPLTCLAAMFEARHAITTTAVAGFAYVSIVSMLLGFFAWYHGLAKVGVARASQLQLAQGPLGALWSHWLLGEAFSLRYGAAFAGVLVFAAVAARSRVRR